MINKKIIMILGMVLLVAGVAYVSAIVLFGGNTYGSNEDKLVLDMDLTQANYVSGTKTFADDSGESNDGVSANAASFTTDKYGMSTGAMNFDGSSDYVLVEGTASLDAVSFTFAHWVKSNEDASTSELVQTLSKNTGHTTSSANYIFSWSHTNSDFDKGCAFTTNNGVSWQVTDITDNLLKDTWYHIVCTYNGTDLAVYVDGSLSLSEVKGVTPDIGNYDLYIGSGQNADSPTSYFNGSISQVKIYNRSLSVAEVMALYNSSKPKMSSSSLNKGLIGHWELDGESYNSATDRVADKTPYSNHGVNYGATLTTDQMGQSNRAMYFDGGSDYVDLGDAVLFNSSKPVTVAFWEYLDSYDVSYPVVLFLKTEQSTGFVFFYSTIASYGGFNFGSNANFLRLRTAGNIGASLAGKWNHFVIVYDGVDRTVNTSYKLYLNNVEQSLVVSGSFAVAPLVNNISTPVSNNQFKGSISDLRIYDRNLSADDVDLLYHSYRPKAASGSLYKGLVLDMPLTSKYITGDTPGSELIRDRTPYSNDGQNNGATVGSNYSSFDGGNDYIEGTYDFYVDNLSVMAWVWADPSISGSWLGIVNKWNTGGGDATDDWGMYYTSGQYSFWLQTSCGETAYDDSTTTFPTGVWTHMVMTYDGVTLKGYADGVQVGTDVVATPCSTNDGTWNLTIGSNRASGSGTPTKFFEGLIDEAKIYNRALSESEIKLLYDKGR